MAMVTPDTHISASIKQGDGNENKTDCGKDWVWSEPTRVDFNFLNYWKMNL